MLSGFFLHFPFLFFDRFPEIFLILDLRNFPEKPTGVDIYLQPELTGDIDVSMMTGEGDGPAGMPLFFWDTVVRRGKKVLAVTTTASKLYQGMKFLTFEIPALP